MILLILGCVGARSEPEPVPIVDTEPPDSDLVDSPWTRAPLPNLVQHACAVTANGTVWCWGAGGAGQLGRGAFTPMKERRGDEVLEVYRHARYLDGSSAAEAPAPAALQAPATAVAAGMAHTCALTREGEVWCWGRNVEGQVGPMPPVEKLDSRAWRGDVPFPVKVPLPEQAERVVAGSDVSCAVGRSKRAWCWGGGSHVPTAVGEDVVDLWVASSSRRCLLHGDGTLCCSERAVPDAVQLEVSGEELCTRDTLPAACRQLVAGHRHVCALLVDDSVWCWSDSEETPKHILDDAREIGAGSTTTCASRADEVVCWGKMLTKQLGEGGRAAVPEPRAVAVSW